MSEAERRDRVPAEQTKSAAETRVRVSREGTRQTSERLTEQAREGMRQASAASTAGAEAAIRTGSSVAEGMQEVANAWAHFAKELMGQTAEASRALLGCRSLTEMFEIQSQLLRGNLQAFLDQSSKITDIAGRMATRPLEALRQASEAAPGR